MNVPIHLSKIEAARRQLKVAIHLLFEDADPVAVHTLVGAASTIISDLVEKHYPDKSWDKLAQDANNISDSEYFQIMRKQQNFLKHAREDHSATFEFSPTDTESLAFWAIMNLGNFGTLSMEESVLQLWYLASHEPLFDSKAEPYNRAIEVFSDLRETPRITRLAIAKKVLGEQLTESAKS